MELLPADWTREYLTEDELMGLLWMEGIDRVKDVRLACIESDGGISVIRSHG